MYTGTDPTISVSMGEGSEIEQTIYNLNQDSEAVHRVRVKALYSPQVQKFYYQANYFYYMDEQTFDTTMADQEIGALETTDEVESTLVDAEVGETLPEELPEVTEVSDEVAETTESDTLEQYAHYP